MFRLLKFARASVPARAGLGGRPRLCQFLPFSKFYSYFSRVKTL